MDLELDRCGRAILARETRVPAAQIAVLPDEVLGEAAMPDEEDTRRYAVVINNEEQYSIWPEDREPPAGWRREGVTGTKEECLTHIDAVWTDMRPLSLRRWMEDQEQAATG